ncbi:hypothetical protein P9112_005878 [Eukaryota sp. TZLM1-RC]
MGICASRNQQQSHSVITPWKHPSVSVSSLHLHSHIDSITSCAISDDGIWFATAGADGDVKVCHAIDPISYSLSHIHSVHWSHSSPCPSTYDPDDITHFGAFDVSSLCFSPPDSPFPVLLTGSVNNAVRSWDLRTGKIIHLFTSFQGQASSLEFSHEDPSVFLFTNDPPSDMFSSIVAVCNVKGKELRRRNFHLTNTRAIWSKVNSTIIVAGLSGSTPKLIFYDFVKNSFVNIEVVLRAPVTAVDLVLIGDGSHFAVRWEVDVAFMDYHLPSWEHFYIHNTSTGNLVKKLNICQNPDLIDSSFFYRFNKSVYNNEFLLSLSTQEGPVSVFKGEYSLPDITELVTFPSGVSLLDLSIEQQVLVLSRDGCCVQVWSLVSNECVFEISDGSKVVSGCICRVSGKILVGFDNGKVLTVKCN